MGTGDTPIVLGVGRHTFVRGISAFLQMLPWLDGSAVGHPVGSQYEERTPVRSSQWCTARFALWDTGIWGHTGRLSADNLFCLDTPAQTTLINSFFTEVHMRDTVVLTYNVIVTVWVLMIWAGTGGIMALSGFNGTIWPNLSLRVRYRPDATTAHIRETRWILRTLNFVQCLMGLGITWLVWHFLLVPIWKA
jgi:hypothetical protein